MGFIINPFFFTDPIIENNTYLDVTSIGNALYIPDYPARVDRIEQQHIQNLNTEPQPPPQLSLSTNTTTIIRPDLIQSYFDNLHSSMPFIDKSNLTQQTTSALLLNAIYAVSSRFMTTHSNNSDPPGWTYYKSALSLIDTYSDIPRLSTVQALLLLTKYHEFIHRPGFFWRTKFFIQLAGQMSSDLGLWKEPSFGTQPTLDHEFEVRRRTFWALYTYQVLMRYIYIYICT